MAEHIQRDRNNRDIRDIRDVNWCTLNRIQTRLEWFSVQLKCEVWHAHGFPSYRWIGVLYTASTAEVFPQIYGFLSHTQTKTHIYIYISIRARRAVILQNHIVRNEDEI